MKRILFVDDDRHVLEGLRRMLRGLRGEWEMAFVESGAAALTHLAQTPCDVVVTDMRMPGMDGAQLLEEIIRRHPDTVRIILSGQCDRQAVVKAVGPAHQFLTKPCDSAALKAAVAKASRLGDRLTSRHYREMISRVQAVPSHPLAYERLRRLLDQPGTTTAQVAALVARDPGMTAKVLQLVSSGFFGPPQPTYSAVKAVQLLGLDTLRDVACQSQAFAPFAAEKIDPLVLEYLYDHCLKTAILARRIVALETDDPAAAEAAFTAALLHDVGYLILAETCPERFGQIISQWHGHGEPLFTVEGLYLHVSHCQMGAYLAALWGWPDVLVEAIAFHHAPADAAASDPLNLAAVHVANLLACGSGECAAQAALIDHEWIFRAGFGERLPQWIARLAPKKTHAGVLL